MVNDIVLLALLNQLTSSSSEVIPVGRVRAAEGPGCHAGAPACPFRKAMGKGLGKAGNHGVHDSFQPICSEFSRKSGCNYGSM